MTTHQPAVPVSIWDELGLVPETELHGGYQSRVFLSRRGPTRFVVKAITSAEEHSLVVERLTFTSRLAAMNEAVVGPIGPPVTADGWMATCYPYVQGDRPDVGSRHDVEAMAVTLAGLHESMAAAHAPNLPVVSGLVTAPTGDPLTRGQVIHGDYAPANLIKTADGLRVIDFDDCGQGSIEFELGNTLYMTHFDAWHTGRPERYEQFRDWFVDAYRAASDVKMADELIDSATRLRARALQHWLDHPADAPPGVRDSSAEWKHNLCVFLESVL